MNVTRTPRLPPTRVDRLAHRSARINQAVAELVDAFGLRKDHAELLKEAARGFDADTLRRAFGARMVEGLERSFERATSMTIWEAAEQLRAHASED